jgi:hypothetical protein
MAIISDYNERDDNPRLSYVDSPIPGYNNNYNPTTNSTSQPSTIVKTIQPNQINILPVAVHQPAQIIQQQVPVPVPVPMPYMQPFPYIQPIFQPTFQPTPFLFSNFSQKPEMVINQLPEIALEDSAVSFFVQDVNYVLIKSIKHPFTGHSPLSHLYYIENICV